ncbi:hypothetical protein [Limnobacter parvus]|uniref:Uncharacterized protein n=1 Tax=Limnobacter parvus TaxID=2939690 RepID=A0ABT1XF06_9BURK|nr:hypothetical protein [Limnobacter parvus]MCR2745464.1 hypothetical protein [Limnobacter parvus]
MNPVNTSDTAHRPASRQVATNNTQQGVKRAINKIVEEFPLFQPTGPTAHIDNLVLSYLGLPESVAHLALTNKLIRRSIFEKLKSFQCNESILGNAKRVAQLSAQLPKVETLVIKSRPQPHIREINAKNLSLKGWAGLKEFDISALAVPSKAFVIQSNNTHVAQIFSNLKLQLGIQTFRFNAAYALASDYLNLHKNLEVLHANNPDLSLIGIEGFPLRHSYRPIRNIEQLAQLGVDLELSVILMMNDRETYQSLHEAENHFASRTLTALLNMPNLTALTIHSIDRDSFDADGVVQQWLTEPPAKSKLASLKVSGLDAHYENRFEDLKTHLPKLKTIDFTPLPAFPALL